MLKLFSQRQLWHFECPKCQNALIETIKNLQQGQNIICPCCKHLITINADEFKKEIGALENAMDKFQLSPRHY